MQAQALTNTHGAVVAADREKEKAVFFKHAKRFVADPSRGGLSRVQYIPDYGLVVCNGYLLIRWEVGGPKIPVQFLPDGTEVKNPLAYPDAPKVFKDHQRNAIAKMWVDVAEWIEAHKAAVAITKAAGDKKHHEVTLRNQPDNGEWWTLELKYKQYSLTVDHLNVNNFDIPKGFVIRYNAEYMLHLFQLIKDLEGKGTVEISVCPDPNSRWAMVISRGNLKALLMPIFQR